MTFTDDYQSLELVDLELRARHPKWFAKVDKIKRKEGWVPWWERGRDDCRRCGGTNWRIRGDKGRTCRDCAAVRQQGRQRAAKAAKR